jgi:hypothetical protein
LFFAVIPTLSTAQGTRKAALAVAFIHPPEKALINPHDQMARRVLYLPRESTLDLLHAEHHRRVLMANNLLSFPRRFAATSPRVSPRISLSAEEAAFTHPRFGLHLADPPTGLIPSAGPALEMISQVSFAVARINLEIANHTTRDRRRRLFAETAPFTPPPAAGTNSR